ncbi:hypothetical protein VTJ04DRAFT_3621 [Mycothermus thermophilus]|uniref:uncharacterized protein n=1 Tax=Humicola insolens TaxID=85995 RepID=UPI00374375CC
MVDASVNQPRGTEYSIVTGDGSLEKCIFTGRRGPEYSIFTGGRGAESGGGPQYSIFINPEHSISPATVALGIPFSPVATGLDIPSSPVAFDGDNGAPTNTGGAENTNTGGRAPPSGLSFRKRAATAGGVGALTLRQPDNIAYRADICSFDFTGGRGADAADHPILTSSGGGSRGGEYSLFTSGDGCSAEYSNFADNLRRSQDSGDYCPAREAVTCEFSLLCTVLAEFHYRAGSVQQLLNGSSLCNGFRDDLAGTLTLPFILVRYRYNRRPSQSWCDPVLGAQRNSCWKLEGSSLRDGLHDGCGNVMRLDRPCRTGIVRTNRT